MTLQETIQKYYVQGNYNCSETLIHAANEYYDLKLDEDSMKVLSGFGGGMFVGSTCGALIGSVAAVSKKVIQSKAHEEIDTFRPQIQKCVRNFKEKLGGMDCKDIKPIHHDKESHCLKTCLLAGEALEQTMKDAGIEQA